MEVTLSMVNRGEMYNQKLLAILQKFQDQSHIRINLVNSDVRRSDLKSYAIYQRGPDVSEIATTWVNDMISMNALRAFSDRELSRIGQQNDFVQGAWQTCHQVMDTHTWAIPFLMESVVIHYRRDWLEKAGVDEGQAFQSLDALHHTAQLLAQIGTPVPVELPYWSPFDQLHALSGWFWSAGCEYISHDGKYVLFNQPEAIKTICRYFNLIRYFSAEGVHAALETQESLFSHGKAAVTFSAHVYKNDPDMVSPEVWGQWRVASYPGEKYLGGSNLAIWKYAHDESAALELIRYLSSPEVQLELVPTSLQLPARLAGLSAPLIQQDPLLRVAAQSALTGRSYPSVPLWGLVEENLMNALHAIHVSLLNAASNNAEINEAVVEKTVRNFIEPQARKINMMLNR